jgi:hypothetical protein
MPWKLICLEGDDRREHASKWGDYNDIPYGWQEVDEEKFIHHFHNATIAKIENRQMYRRDENDVAVELLQGRLFFTYNEPHVALVVSKDYKTFRYFLFGCDHDWKFVENLGRCYNRYKCSKCGRQWDIDSSD